MEEEPEGSGVSKQKSADVPMAEDDREEMERDREKMEKAKRQAEQDAARADDDATEDTDVRDRQLLRRKLQEELLYQPWCRRLHFNSMQMAECANIDAV